MLKSVSREALFYIAIIISAYFLLPLEYDNFKIKIVLHPLIWTSIVLLILKIFPGGKTLKRAVTAWIGSGVYLLLLFLNIFMETVFCNWGNIGSFYISKTEASVKLVCRTYNCYGTADDCQLFKVSQLTTHIKWVTKFTEKRVDSIQWKSIPFNTIEFNQP
jgi:hypothetical protein